MKPYIYIAPFALVVVGAFGLAACVPSNDTQPVSTPTPSATSPTTVARPVVQQVPVKQPRFENYLDAPQTRGDWSYWQNQQGGKTAIFGTNQQSPDFIIRCTGQRVALTRSAPRGFGNNIAMSITTETAARNFSATLFAAGTSQVVGIGLDARDPFLDAMAITKGRIAVETQGLPTLYLPAWPEISRVIEDCR